MMLFFVFSLRYLFLECLIVLVWESSASMNQISIQYCCRLWWFWSSYEDSWIWLGTDGNHHQLCDELRESSFHWIMCQRFTALSIDNEAQIETRRKICEFSSNSIWINIIAFVPTSSHHSLLWGTPSFTFADDEHHELWNCERNQTFAATKIIETDVKANHHRRVWTRNVTKCHKWQLILIVSKMTTFWHSLLLKIFPMHVESREIQSFSRVTKEMKTNKRKFNSRVWCTAIAPSSDKSSSEIYNFVPAEITVEVNRKGSSKTALHL